MRARWVFDSAVSVLDFVLIFVYGILSELVRRIVS